MSEAPSAATAALQADDVFAWADETRALCLGCCSDGRAEAEDMRPVRDIGAVYDPCSECAGPLLRVVKTTEGRAT